MGRVCDLGKKKASLIGSFRHHPRFTEAGAGAERRRDKAGLLSGAPVFTGSVSMRDGGFGGGWVTGMEGAVFELGTLGGGPAASGLRNVPRCAQRPLSCGQWLSQGGRRSRTKVSNLRSTPLPPCGTLPVKLNFQPCHSESSGVPAPDAIPWNLGNERSSRRIVGGY